MSGKERRYIMRQSRSGDSWVVGTQYYTNPDSKLFSTGNRRYFDTREEALAELERRENSLND